MLVAITIAVLSNDAYRAEHLNELPSRVCVCSAFDSRLEMEHFSILFGSRMPEIFGRPNEQQLIMNYKLNGHTISTFFSL